ncbi:MAG TPA: glycine cleavage T C-terminal barrel domain-containing protein [Pyrinomonadaceae bacterium]|nr:glycine cleavage T C-terminal barrel domain-containing protein [Pyrinomonadaceae bacterium]
MTLESTNVYEYIRGGSCGFYEQRRALIAVWGKESIQFLNGLITNDVAKLEDGGQMLAAFPNAQGRLLALVRVMRQGEKFLFETEEATHEKLYNNLFRFTFAGDFFVEDLSDGLSYFEIFGPKNDVYNPRVGEKFAGAFAFESPTGAAYFIPNELADDFRKFLSDDNGCLTITDDLYETLRIESGIPKYGVDMDETTIVPELGLDGLISYNKGCYIGQEIIARIHFRGHVAKQLTGLIFEEASAQQAETRPVGSVPLNESELKTTDGKNAGRITSVTYSPKLQKTIALAYVRYNYLAEGSELLSDGLPANVKSLPFIS